MLIHGSTLCLQVKSLLARSVNLENEAVQARQRQGSAEKGVGSGQPTYPAVVLRKQCTHHVSWSHRHAHTGQAEDVHRSASGMDNLAIHVQGFACATHPRVRDVFKSATRKGSDPVTNSDMTVELQSLSTQLYYMLVMMLSDQALEISLQKELVPKCGASCSGVRTWRWYQIRSNVAIAAEATVR